MHTHVLRLITTTDKLVTLHEYKLYHLYTVYTLYTLTETL